MREGAPERTQKEMLLLSKSFFEAFKTVYIAEKTVQFLSAMQNLVVKPSNFFEKFVYNIS